MRYFLKSILAGAVSGALTYPASRYALGFTSAFAMPHGFPVALWQSVVVFGIGAVLVAFLLHILIIVALTARTIPALLAFAATGILALAWSGMLTYGGPVIAAWLIGGLLASVVYSQLRPNNAFKPTADYGPIQ